MPWIESGSALRRAGVTLPPRGSEGGTHAGRLGVRCLDGRWGKSVESTDAQRPLPKRGVVAGLPESMSPSARRVLYKSYVYGFTKLKVPPKA